MRAIVPGAVEMLGRQAWLDPLADRLQGLVNGAVQAGGGAGPAIKNVLHGVWLGHPLHPALTDIPVGAWTVAAVLDALDAAGHERLGPGADAAVGIGLLGAAGSVVSGLADWSATDGPPRRQGLVHALLNAGATALYLTSFVMRRGGNRPAARGLAFLGLGIATVSAYIGGYLVAAERIGVDHAPRESPPYRYTTVMAEADLSDDAPTRAELDGLGVVLVRHQSRVYALAETCAHLGGPLAEGTVEGESIICPWHGSRFSLRDGRVQDGPSTFDQPCFVARIRDGQVQVRGERPRRDA